MIHPTQVVPAGVSAVPGFVVVGGHHRGIVLADRRYDPGRRVGVCDLERPGLDKLSTADRREAGEAEVVGVKGPWRAASLRSVRAHLLGEDVLRCTANQPSLGLGIALPSAERGMVGAVPVTSAHPLKQASRTGDPLICPVVSVRTDPGMRGLNQVA